jgi:hypothetical protein
MDDAESFRNRNSRRELGDREFKPMRVAPERLEMTLDEQNVRLEASVDDMSRRVAWNKPKHKQ